MSKIPIQMSQAWLRMQALKLYEERWITSRRLYAYRGGQGDKIGIVCNTCKIMYCNKLWHTRDICGV